MQKNSIITIIIMLIVLMILTIIFTAFDNLHNLRSVYELGFASGYMYKNVLENLLTFATIWILYKKNNENKRIQNFLMFMIAVLILSIIFASTNKLFINTNANQNGYFLGLIYKNLLKTAIIANILVVIFQKINVSITSSNLN